MGYLDGPNLITKVLKSGRGRQKSESEGCHMRRTPHSIPQFLTLKMEEWGMSQEMWVIYRFW